MSKSLTVNVYFVICVNAPLLQSFCVGPSECECLCVDEYVYVRS